MSTLPPSILYELQKVFKFLVPNVRKFIVIVKYTTVNVKLEAKSDESKVQEIVQFRNKMRIHQKSLNRREV
jgi:hypothetical protein